MPDRSLDLSTTRRLTWLYAPSILFAILFSLAPTTEKLRSLSSPKTLSVALRGCFFFLTAGVVVADVAPESGGVVAGVELELEARRVGETSTCAERLRR